MNFNEMNVSNEIKMALQDMGFENPTPIQEKVIPLILDKQDVIAQAPTGTGKTCAFGIPAINNIDYSLNNVQALILCPTRELVIQTENELKEVAKYCTGLKIISIYGGQNIERQLSGLRKNPQIIIGTTGRVMDHLRRKSLKLQGLKLLILDEVDEMLDMGFREDIDVILTGAPTDRQTVMFSATMPKEIIEISKLYQKAPISIKTKHQKSELPDIDQFFVLVSESEKINILSSIITEKKYGLVLVFCNTKKRVDELCSYLNQLGFIADALHGDLRQQQRDKTMKKFRSGETQVLIATDVAARGIDVDNIEAVFNFDIPHDEEYYVHRIGRTARAKKTGAAYTFVSEKQMYVINNFERFTKSAISRADFSANAEKSIDKKRFDKIVKAMKRNDLTVYKEFLRAELIKINEKYEDIEMIDIAAAFLMQASESESAKILSEPPKMTVKPLKGSRSLSKGVRFFMNIGTRDKCDEKNMKKLLSEITNIPSENILDVKCLENFSFVSVSEENSLEMEGLNGLRHNNRFLAVEIAAGKGKTPERKKETNKDANKYNATSKNKEINKDKETIKDFGAKKANQSRNKSSQFNPRSKNKVKK